MGAADIVPATVALISPIGVPVEVDSDIVPLVNGAAEEDVPEMLAAVAGRANDNTNVFGVNGTDEDNDELTLTLDTLALLDDDDDDDDGDDDTATPLVVVDDGADEVEAAVVVDGDALVVVVGACVALVGRGGGAPRRRSRNENAAPDD